MTAHATVERELPGTPAEIVERLRDPAVAQQRAQSDGVLVGEVIEFAPGGAGEPLALTIAAELPASWIPAQKGRGGAGLPGRPRIVRREVWHLHDDGTADIDVDVEPESVPATTMAVTGFLEPTGDPAVSLLTFAMSLTVGVPLVGARIERTVLDRIRGAYERECDVIASACG